MGMDKALVVITTPVTSTYVMVLMRINAYLKAMGKPELKAPQLHVAGAGGDKKELTMQNTIEVLGFKADAQAMLNIYVDMPPEPVPENPGCYCVIQ
ncbi:hypothetical protein EV183_005555 [Coemansia sp. RSA 2336]|nr:hypothetical protein EV183_005555 [Coemansia sp. RSA 2336]